MQLELAIVQACTQTGCQARLLQTKQNLDTLYSKGILNFQIEICPGDLVVLDISSAPPRTVFCFARTQIERVQTQVYTDRHQGAQSPIEGLDALLQPGDWVFATMDHVYDRCVDGLPADPDRLWMQACPMVESLVRSDKPAPEPEPAPVCAAQAATPPHVEYLTAETERGRQALQTVMVRSYQADWEGLPPEWTLVRLVDGVPVSFIVVNPHPKLDMTATVIARSGSDEAIPTDAISGDTSIPYAFVNDVATRADRRREGHFRALMEHTYDRLRQAGYSLILLHGRYPLYRPLGFDVFTHHSGIFITPEQVERALGAGNGQDHSMIRFDDARWIKPDLLVVTEVQASSQVECAAALRAAAALARNKGRDRILFEHPAAPCGYRYTAHASPETPFTALARTYGAEVRLQGADPESGTIPDADWIKVLDAAAFVTQALACRPVGARPSSSPPCPVRGGLRGGLLALDTDAGAVTIANGADQVTAHEGIASGAQVVHWPSSALAQLVTGYRPAETLALIHSIELPPEALAFLSALFPTCWRFSRNESWTFH